MPEDKNTDNIDNGGVNEPEFSPIEAEAINMGWNPDKENLPEGKTFIEAGEFVRNQTWVNELKRTNTKMDRMAKEHKATIEGLKTHNKLIQKKAYEKALAELKAEKKAAIKDDDFERALEIDDKIDETREEMDTELEATDNDTSGNAQVELWNDAAARFVEDPDNKWYNTNPDMAEYADSVGSQLATQHPNDPDFVYGEIQKRVKRLFPQEFGNPQRKAPAKVGAADRGTGAAASSKGKHRLSELPQDVQAMAKESMELYGMSEKEYLKDYFGE